jgi:hypothetical protein
MNKWTRRSILAGSAILALPFVSFSASKFWCRWNGLPQARGSALVELASLYSGSTAIKHLGERYLAQTGQTVSRSLRRLRREDKIINAAKTGCRDQILAAIEQVCRNEFKVGCVHFVDGWVLAQTELDLAAIQALA